MSKKQVAHQVGDHTGGTAGDTCDAGPGDLVKSEKYVNVNHQRNVPIT